MDNRTPTPGQQAIKDLPMIAQVIDGMLVAATEQYQTLQESELRPLVLNGYALKRLIKVFNMQQSDLWLFNEQLRHWQTGSPALTPNQATEIEYLVGQMLGLQQVVTNIIGLAEQLEVEQHKDAVAELANSLQQV